jgi:hypothetical protein
MIADDKMIQLLKEAIDSVQPFPDDVAGLATKTQITRP